MLKILKKALKTIKGAAMRFILGGRQAAWAWSIYRMKGLLGVRQPLILTIKPRRAKYPLIARSGGSSDMCVIDQIFLCEEYAPIRDISSPRLILDLGANVGYSSAYFLSCFPTATVVAVEPDPGNVELCRKNLAPYGDRAQIVLGAVWSNRVRLLLSRGTFGDGREWATQVLNSEGKENEATVDGWDIPSLLQMVGGTEIDLLKVDIEGSELELFSSTCSSWLHRVRNICIEFHGADCKAVFRDALKDFEYDLGTSGELTICRHLHRKTMAAHN